MTLLERDSVVATAEAEKGIEAPSPESTAVIADKRDAVKNALFAHDIETAWQLIRENNTPEFLQDLLRLFRNTKDTPQEVDVAEFMVAAFRNGRFEAVIQLVQQGYLDGESHKSMRDALRSLRILSLS